MSIPTTKIILTTLLLTLASPAIAQTQFYDSKGRYVGQAQPNGTGGYQFYGPRGQYTGQAQPAPQGWQLYGPQGHYQGQTITPPSWDLNLGKPLW